MNFANFRCMSFDCFGTLVDWETGLRTALGAVFNRQGVPFQEQKALQSFARAESAVQAEVYRPYKIVLRETLIRVGHEFGFSPSLFEQKQFSASINEWPLFPDSVESLTALKSRYKLVILTNCDDEVIAQTVERLGVDFDEVFTAEQIGAYKPSRKVFEHLLARVNVHRSTLLHVAQSKYHDIVPAKKLGLATVWVNRRHGQEGTGATPEAAAQPDLEVPDLRSLAIQAGVLQG